MSAYGNINRGVPGMIATSDVRRVETASAVSAISFGQPVFSSEGKENEVDVFKKDTASITFSTDLIASNSTIVTVNGVATTATVFATDHATTVAAIVVKIKALGYDAKVDTTDAKIIWVSKDNTVLTVSAVTTLGSTQPTIAIAYSTQQIFRGIALFSQKAPGGYVINDAVSIMSKGDICVDCSVAMKGLDEVYFDYSVNKFTSVASGNLDLGMVVIDTIAGAGVTAVTVNGQKRMATEINY